MSGDRNAIFAGPSLIPLPVPELRLSSENIVVLDLAEHHQLAVYMSDPVQCQAWAAAFTRATALLEGQQAALGGEQATS